MRLCNEDDDGDKRVLLLSGRAAFTASVWGMFSGFDVDVVPLPYIYIFKCIFLCYSLSFSVVQLRCTTHTYKDTEETKDPIRSSNSRTNRVFFRTSVFRLRSVGRRG